LCAIYSFLNVQQLNYRPCWDGSGRCPRTAFSSRTAKQSTSAKADQCRCESFNIAMVFCAIHNFMSLHKWRIFMVHKPGSHA